MPNITPRQEQLARWTTTGTAAQGLIPAPGSGATITVWDSNADGIHPFMGYRYKRLIWNSVASASSAANGLSFEESFDDGANWDVIVQYSYVTPNVDQRFVAVAAPRLRVRYTNSAAVLTTWRGALIGDEYERGTQ